MRAASLTWFTTPVVIALAASQTLAQASPAPQATAHDHGNDPARPKFTQDASGRVRVGDLEFNSLNEYVNSDYFRENGLRCGTPNQFEAEEDGGAGGVAGGTSPQDCTFSYTNPDEAYDPSVRLYRIPVVFHVIRADDGITGHVPEPLIHSQIEVLNEDFLAIAGSNGEDGTNIQIEFYLATEDPQGQPTTGITYSDNDTWFADAGSYWNTLAWDTNRYMNVYSNLASGALGYVPNLPQSNIAGLARDRVVVLWEAVGRNSPIGAPYNQGRTLTHEVGHYLGLMHVFQDGCSSPSNCYTAGDRVCDTGPQIGPFWQCSSQNSCGATEAIHNYMNYTDDYCMGDFTPEQARRMRCSLEHFREDVYEIDLCGGPAAGLLDQQQDDVDYGFDFTDTTLWQEFTPTSAYLETLKIFLLTNFPPYESIEAGVLITGPTGQIIWSDEFNFDGYWTDWVCFTTEHLPVTANQPHRIWVSGTGGIWLGNTASAYPGYSSADQGPGAETWDGFDFAFQTIGDGIIVPECPADLNGDGAVNTPDLVEVIVSWGPCNGCPADFDGNGVVNVPDLLEVIINWGPCE